MKCWKHKSYSHLFHFWNWLRSQLKNFTHITELNTFKNAWKKGTPIHIKYPTSVLGSLKFFAITCPKNGLSLKDTNFHLVRFRLKLEEFDYHIIHKGSKNTNAHALLRIEVYPNEVNPELPILHISKNLAKNRTFKWLIEPFIIEQRDPKDENEEMRMETTIPYTQILKSKFFDYPIITKNN